MTNLPRRNGLRALPDLPPDIKEPPGGHILIGQPPQPPPQQRALTLFELAGMLCNDLANLPDFATETARILNVISERGTPASPEETYALSALSVLDTAQRSIRELATAEFARRNPPATESQ